MADNYNIKDAANSTIAIAADEVAAGVFSPRVTPLHNGTDVTDSNRLPVNATVSGNVTVQDGGNSITVDGSVGITGALPAGTNNIGDVDVLSLPPLPAGSNTIGAVTISGTPAVTVSGTPTVSLSGALPAGSNAIGSVGVTGSVSVQDGGGSLTVDGTVAATQSGTWNLGNITGSITLPTGAATAANQTTIIGHIDGIEGLLTGISANTPALVSGKVPVDVGSITISNLTIGDVTVDNTASNPVPVSDANGSLTVDGAVSITGSLPTGSNTIGAVTISGTPAVSVSGTPTVSISGTPSVSITGGLPTGANTIGAVTVSGTPSVSISGTPSVSITGTPAVSLSGAIPAGTNNIGDVDILSVIPGTGATNLGKAEDAAHTSGDVGVMTLAVRNDAMNSLVSANGDYAPLMVNQDGHLVIYNYDISASVGLLNSIWSDTNTLEQDCFKWEDQPHINGDRGVMTLAVRKDTAGTLSSADGDYTPLQVDANGSLRVNVTASTASGGGGTQYDEDTAHTSGDKGTMALAVRKDTAAALAGTDGDYIPLIVDNAGKLWVNTGSVTIDSSSPVSVAGNLAVVSAEFTRPSDTTAYAVGDVVANSTSAAAPLQISGCARVNAGSGYIVGVELIADQKSITPSFRVHVFNAAPTQSNDNAAYRALYADASKRVGEFVLGPLSTPADTTNSTLSRAVDMNLRFPFVCAGGSTTLHFIFEALTAFTPASGGKFTLQLTIDQN